MVFESLGMFAFFFGEFGLHDLLTHEYKKAATHFLLFFIPTFLFGYRFTLPDSLFQALNHWAWIYSILILANWVWAIIEAAKYDPNKPVATKNKKISNGDSETLKKADDKTSALVSKIKTARVVTYVNIIITAPIWLTLLMIFIGLPPSFGFLPGGGAAVIAIVFFPLLLITSIVLFAISLVPFFLVRGKNKSNVLVDLEFKKFETAFLIQILLIVFVIIYFVFK